MPAKRAPDTQRERLIEILQAVPERCIEQHYGPTPHHNGCVTTPDYDAMADVLLAVREGDGYEGIANDLVRELGAARERIAALEKALAKEELQGKIEQAETRLRTLERALEKSHRRMMAHAPLAWVGQCFACDALAPTVGRPALDYGVHAGLNTGFASGCAATWEELQDGKCHEPGHWTPPTAGRSAS